MAEQDQSVDELALINATLRSQGLDPDNLEIRQAVIAASSVIHRLERIRSEELRQSIEAAVFETRIEVEKFAIRQQRFSLFAATAVGLSGLLLGLITGFQPFIEAIRAIFANVGITITSVITPAFAQAVAASPPTPSPAVTPILVYGVYCLLGAAYVFNGYQTFFGKTPEDKTNAMDIFKNLNAFFIGVIGGKIV